MELAYGFGALQRHYMFLKFFVFGEVVPVLKFVIEQSHQMCMVLLL